MRNFDLSPLMRQWIGFDKLANALQNAGESQSFPPYNIEKSDDNHYRITLALAGFRQEDLEIQLEGTRLSVKGTPEQPKEEKKWLHQGLMNQPFSLSFTLAENMEVSGATFVNGLLHIDLIRNEPEPIAAQRIAISERPALNSYSLCPAILVGLFLSFFFNNALNFACLRYFGTFFPVIMCAIRQICFTDSAIIRSN